MSLLSSLDSFLDNRVSELGNRPIVVAFSGGPDSAALLWALASLAPPRNLPLHAAHLDHRLDPDSGRRAVDALHLAEEIGIACSVEAIEGHPGPGDSIEGFARHHRYRFLAKIAERLDASMILTAHHADDQAETLLLRILFGTGLSGLAGIRPTFGKVHRPLLQIRRAEIQRAFAHSGLAPVIDPTNRDPKVPRNLVRHLLLPRFELLDREIVPRLGRIATSASRWRDRSLALLGGPLQLSADDRGAGIDRAALLRMPPQLQQRALALLAECAGARYPLASTVRRELLAQLGRGGGIGCDAGAGWRLETERSKIRMVRLEPNPPHFAYTSKAPGVIDVPELAVRIRIEPEGNQAQWMYRRNDNRVGLAIDDRPNPCFEIRNRRPGDRIRPLGADRDRRLKSLLNSNRVPRSDRDRLPLLLIDGEIAWVPGVATSESFRLTPHSTSIWTVKIEPLSVFSPQKTPSPESPFPGRLDRKVAEP